MSSKITWILATFLIGAFWADVAKAEEARFTHYERSIIATCLVLEASSDGQEGMTAVLNVIFNRADRQHDRVLEVISRPRQFTALNAATAGQRNYGPLLARAMKDPNFDDAYRLVLKMERGELVDNTFGADHYHSGPRPAWARSMRRVTTVGSQQFYTSKPTYARSLAMLR